MYSCSHAEGNDNQVFWRYLRHDERKFVKRVAVEDEALPKHNTTRCRRMTFIKDGRAINGRCMRTSNTLAPDRLDKRKRVSPQPNHRFVIRKNAEDALGHFSLMHATLDSESLAIL